MKKQTPLGEMLYLYKMNKHMGDRGLAKDIGLSLATVHRIQHGGSTDMPSWLTLQLWLAGQANGVQKRGGARKKWSE